MKQVSSFSIKNYVSKQLSGVSAAQLSRDKIQMFSCSHENIGPPQTPTNIQKLLKIYSNGLLHIDVFSLNTISSVFIEENIFLNSYSENFTLYSYKILGKLVIPYIHRLGLGQSTLSPTFIVFIGKKLIRKYKRYPYFHYQLENKPFPTKNFLTFPPSWPIYHLYARQSSFARLKRKKCYFIHQAGLYHHFSSHLDLFQFTKSLAHNLILT